MTTTAGEQVTSRHCRRPRIGGGAAQLGLRLHLVDLAAYAAASTLAVGLAGLWGSWLSVVLASGLALVGLGLHHLAGLYRRRVCRNRNIEHRRLLAMSVIHGAVTGVATTGTVTTLEIWTVTTVVAFLLLSVGRGLYRDWLTIRRARGDLGDPVLVVGTTSSAADVTAFLDEHTYLGFNVMGVVDLGDGRQRAVPDSRVAGRHVGTLEDGLAFARQVGCTGAVVNGRGLTGDQLRPAVHALSEAGLHVHVDAGIHGIDPQRLTVSTLADETYLHVTPRADDQVTTRAGKRAMDVVLSALGLLVLSPVLAIVALAVKLEDRGPVLFRQVREGHHRQPFQLIKFRTMVVDAEDQLDDARNARGGPLYKDPEDRRVTRVGALLRATSLDELPQLWNVLRGEMSLVGPRPALPRETALFSDELHRRSVVRPGVTGLWQVEARDLPSFDLYQRYDLLYANNWSLGLDVLILLQTVASVIGRPLRSIREVAVGDGTGSAGEAAEDVVIDLADQQDPAGVARGRTTTSGSDGAAAVNAGAS